MYANYCCNGSNLIREKFLFYQTSMFTKREINIEICLLTLVISGSQFYTFLAKKIMHGNFCCNVSEKISDIDVKKHREKNKPSSV